MFDEHKIKEKVKVSSFVKKIERYGHSNIETTTHTFFRLSEKQRKIYTEKDLKKIVFEDRPLEVSIQKNGNYAVIYTYDKEQKLLKVLLDLSTNKVYIVTFYILNRRQEKEFKNG